MGQITKKEQNRSRMVLFEQVSSRKKFPISSWATLSLCRFGRRWRILRVFKVYGQKIQWLSISKLGLRGGS
jgi:hypothetical protein